MIYVFFQRHFHQNQYEIKICQNFLPKRVLSSNAIPHLFLDENTENDYNEAVKIRKNVETLLEDHQYITKGITRESKKVLKNSFIFKTDANEVEIETTDHKMHETYLENVNLKSENEALKSENEKLKEKVKFRDENTKSLLQKIEMLQKKNSLLEVENRKRLPRKLFQKIFGEDQIKFLENGHVQWNDETIKKGLKIRFSAGSRGKV